MLFTGSIAQARSSLPLSAMILPVLAAMVARLLRQGCISPGYRGRMLQATSISAMLSTTA